jgi:hypothetical protein
VPKFFGEKPPLVLYRGKKNVYIISPTITYRGNTTPKQKRKWKNVRIGRNKINE